MERLRFASEDLNVTIIEIVTRSSIIEAQYPNNFREKDALALSSNLASDQSLVLIGIKRVGISNFLRFYLNHPHIISQLERGGRKYLFIKVDLNDLVEKEIYPFWVLTFKRIVDATEESSLDTETQKKIAELFLDSIQSKHLVLLLDGIRKSLQLLVEERITPTIFFVRFDRMRESVTPDFFANLQSLKDVAHRLLTLIFTSFRSLDQLAPLVFSKASLSMFAKNMYLKPVHEEDLEIIYNVYQKNYDLSFSLEIKKKLFESVGGYIQFLQLALILLHENRLVVTPDQLFDALCKDERIILQCEELWESLTPDEKQILLKIHHKQPLRPEDKEKGAYLWDTGMVHSKGKLFSPLFSYFLESNMKHKSHTSVDFTKKELLFFHYLENNKLGICDRESIITAVWPEEEDLGVSDWAIDRLVSRVRSKLKKQKSRYQIVTIKTRGFRLVES